MARPAKSLLELIRDNGFRPDRHAHLVSAERLPRRVPEWAGRDLWGKLRHAQTRYCDELAKERAGVPYSLAPDYLKAFSGAVRALHGGRLPWLLGG